LAISRAIWGWWNWPKMEAYVGFPYDQIEMHVTTNPRIWLVTGGSLSLTGLDVGIGYWGGADSTDENDPGNWDHEAFSACNPPASELLMRSG